MSVLIYIDQREGQIKKASLEALNYGAKVAEMLGTTAVGLVLGTVQTSLPDLGKYGVSTIYHCDNVSFNTVDDYSYVLAITQAVTELQATVVVVPYNQMGKSIAPQLSAKLKAGLVAGANSLPNISNGFTVTKSVFSGKALATVAVNTAVKIIGLQPNSYSISLVEGTAMVTPITLNASTPKIVIKAVNKLSGEVPLTEADIVVSGGRGLKGPENWGIILDLAKSLGAATACSRPVGDAHWRPHHEHVGQTGVQIAPNLYIAVGISGAIQHLAGVNRSKVIVVINKDPEAPFFKAADYGIVGDCFDVLPKLTAAINAFKSK